MAQAAVLLLMAQSAVTLLKPQARWMMAQAAAKLAAERPSSACLA